MIQDNSTALTLDSIMNKQINLEDEDPESFKEEVLKKYKDLDDECERIINKIRAKRKK